MVQSENLALSGSGVTVKADTNVDIARALPALLTVTQLFDLPPPIDLKAE